MLLSTGEATREGGSTLQFSEVALAVERTEKDKVVEGDNFEFTVSGEEASPSSEKEKSVEVSVDEVSEIVLVESSQGDEFSVYGDMDDQLFQTTESA